jgi:hypothetical protein
MQAIEGGESPVLGQASGRYRELAVLPILQRHFLSTWFHHMPLGVAKQTAVAICDVRGKPFAAR